jgi:hypothetical protein
MNAGSSVYSKHQADRQSVQDGIRHRTAQRSNSVTADGWADKAGSTIGDCQAGTGAAVPTHANPIAPAKAKHSDNQQRPKLHAPPPGEVT